MTRMRHKVPSFDGNNGDEGWASLQVRFALVSSLGLWERLVINDVEGIHVSSVFLVRHVSTFLLLHFVNKHDIL